MSKRLLIVTLALLVSGTATHAAPGGESEASSSCSEGSSALVVAAGASDDSQKGEGQRMKAMPIAPGGGVKGAILEGGRAIPQPGYRFEEPSEGRVVLMKGDDAVGDIDCQCDKKGKCKEATQEDGKAYCKKNTCTGECFVLLEPFPDKGAPGSTDLQIRRMQKAAPPKVEQVGE